MRYFIVILCLVQFQVEASSDWFNRTIRVDLIVDSSHRIFDPQSDKFERSNQKATTEGVSATNGQYPWSILLDIWAPDTRFLGSGSIISNNFALTDLHCSGQLWNPNKADLIAVHSGSAQWPSDLRARNRNFVRTLWYIEPSSEIENSPNIVLMRLNTTIIFNPNIQPIRLPSYKDFSYENWSSIMLGFRHISQDVPWPRDQLESAHITISNSNLCNLNGRSIADHEICGIDGNEPSASGHVMRLSGITGGPWIVYEYTDAGQDFVPVLIGFHTHQFANETGSYGLATRVSHFMDWITFTRFSEEN